jgi:hypothetical protein
MTTSTPRRRQRAIDLTAYGAELDAFVAEIGEERYLGLSGQTDEMALAPIYARHAALFNRDAVDGLARLASGSDDAARQARRLHGLAIEAYLQHAVADLTDRIAAAEASAIVMWQGQPVAYRALPARVAESADRAERNILDASYREAVEAINPLRMERLARQRETARDLGFDDLVAVADTINGFDAAALAGHLQAFTAASETVYYAALRRYLAEIDIESGDASIADLQHLLRASSWDAWFEPRRLNAAVAGTLRGMGIDLAEQANVRLDMERRPNKSPRAFCVPVRVPDDVRLVIQPRGGHEDYAAALHEIGHVEHFALTDASLPAADRHAGDASVTEAYATLLQGLLSEPAWLAEHLGMPAQEIAGFIDFAAFRKLYLLRRYTAKLLYELRLLRDPDPAVGRATYAGMLGLLSGVQIPESSWLADVDDNLYAARYLRSWMLEGSLAAALRTAHGETWWRERAAGDQLKGLWRQGQRPNAEDVLAQLGYDQLDWRPILHQLRLQLIGELSGYGGPNITTRAGTRKV